MVNLWNLIRDFFVQYIFGGWNSENMPYYGFLGRFVDNDGLYTFADTSDTFIPLNNSWWISDEYEGYFTGYCFGDYLSTIATIISLVVIVMICCLFIKKIYNICAHVIG